MMKKYVTCVALLLLPGLVWAEEDAKAPLPSADSMEPEVVITPSDDKQIREYRVNGQLYMIEIKPSKGPAYYLVDMDGDGKMETRHVGADSNLVIPRWTLLKW